jgi:two-component system sensor histidine kinase KdpD
MSEKRAGVAAGYARAVAAVAAATAVGWPLYHGLHLPDDSRHPPLANTNVLMFYLLAVLWVSTRHAAGPAALTSVLGVAAFDFCFVPPYLTFTVHDQQYLVTFTVMLSTALVISTLTRRGRQQSEAARAARARLEEESLRNTLLSGVSHELRTPLAAITGAAGALAGAGGTLAPDARDEMIRTVAAGAERMEQLITNLLDMTRLESGGLALKKEWQPVEELVGSALHEVDRRLRGRAVRTDLPPGLPPVSADAVAMQQVLLNLLDNALRYTPDDSPLDVTARGAGGQLVLEVSDRGPGLPPGTEERVFEKFFRARPAEGPRGVGLGLAIARGIVEAHGGTLTAHNRPGGGATFRLTLPAARPVELERLEERDAANRTPDPATNPNSAPHPNAAPAAPFPRSVPR